MALTRMLGHWTKLPSPCRTPIQAHFEGAARSSVLSQVPHLPYVFYLPTSRGHECVNRGRRTGRLGHIGQRDSALLSTCWPPERLIQHLRRHIERPGCGFRKF